MYQTERRLLTGDLKFECTFLNLEDGVLEEKQKKETYTINISPTVKIYPLVESNILEKSANYLQLFHKVNSSLAR